MSTTQPKPSLDQLQVLGLEYNAGNSSTAISITWTNGFNQKVTLTASCTITVNSPAIPGRYQLRLIQNGSGAFTVTWAGSAYSASRWVGATSAPAVNTATAGETIVTFYFDGTNFTQSIGLLNSATGGGTGTSGYSGYSGGGSGFSGYSGSGGSLTITNDTSTNATEYPVYANATSGTMSTAYTSDTKLTYNPSTGVFSATTFTSLSDGRMKENVRPLLDSVEVINALAGKSFTFKHSGNQGVGLIAQEVELIAPGLVVTDGLTDRKSVNYDSLTAYLIEYVKTLNARVEALEARDR